MQNSLSPEWVRLFTDLDHENDSLLCGILSRAQVSAIGNGENVICDRNLLFVLDGCIRIRVVSRCGHELTLCKIRPGKICWLNVAVLLGSLPCPQDIVAVVESDVRVASLPEGYVTEALDGSPAFRSYVLRELSKGLMELSALVEDVAFGQMNRRVAQCLLDSAYDGRVIHMTHHDVADELGTAREVVSRLLKDFERHGLVRLHRGHIEVKDGRGLRLLVENGSP